MAWGEKETNLWVYQEETHDALGIVDRYSDLRIAWRYNTPGEIEFSVPVRNEENLLVKPGMLIWPTGGREAFVVDTTTIAEREDGNAMEVRGYTASALLGRRCLYKTREYEGTCGAIIKEMLDEVFADEARRFNHFAYNINTALGDVFTYATEPMPVLDAIVNLCKASGLGFMCAFDPITLDLTWGLYQGEDHTGSSDNPIIFDAEYENIAEATYKDSVSDVATMAYVLGESRDQYAVQYNPDGSTTILNHEKQRDVVIYDPSSVSGYARYEVILESGKSRTTDQKNPDGSPVIMPDAQYKKVLQDYGKEQVEARARATSIEGELIEDSPLFSLGDEYTIGDIVVIRNQLWDVSVESRISELEESYASIRTLRITVGSRVPTLIEKIKRK